MIIFPAAIAAIEDDSDREFMENLFLNYHRLMYHEIFMIVEDPWQTEDILQSTIIRLINSMDTIRDLPTRKLVNYIISACKNNAYNQIRSNSRRRETLVADWFSDNEFLDDAQSPEEHVLRHEEVDALAKVWDTLDERSKYLLRGRYILNLSYQQMAEELQVKPESVRMALTRAKRTAAKEMKKTVPDD